jgi:hypothetical protein
MNTLSKENSSPIMNSSISAGSAGDGGETASHCPNCSADSARNVPRAPAPAGGLTTTGNPHCSTIAQASCALVARPWRAHGTPAARSTSFIRDLSRKLAASPESIPVMPSHSRTWASGTWRSSRMLNARSTEPSRLPASRNTSGQLPGVETVVDPHVGDEPRGQLLQAPRRPARSRRGRHAPLGGEPRRRRIAAWPPTGTARQRRRWSSAADSTPPPGRRDPASAVPCRARTSSPPNGHGEVMERS